MRAVVQRVSQARVLVEGVVVGEIGMGFVVLLGIGRQDDVAAANYLAEKIAGLRVFSDSEGKMNLCLSQVGGALLVISQFTLHGDCRRGKRPSFDEAAKPEVAVPLYQCFVDTLLGYGLTVATGSFGAMMQVELVNEGPVTLLLDSDKLF